jgi:predicted membrane protein
LASAADIWRLILDSKKIISCACSIIEEKKNCSWNSTFDSKGSFTKNSIFGGGEHIVLEPDFNGGEINAIFGDLTLDLRHTNLSEGISRLEVNAVFGGISIFVPNEWYVEMNTDAVFGGVEDKRMKKQPLNTERKLLITGACVFGGIDLSN